MSNDEAQLIFEIILWIGRIIIYGCILYAFFRTYEKTKENNEILKRMDKYIAFKEMQEQVKRQQEQYTTYTEKRE